MKTTIAINIGHKFVAIEAELIGIAGITLALHKTPSKSGWSVTDPKSGVAIHSCAETTEEARYAAAIKIGNYGVQALINKLATLSKAPPVDACEPYVAPAKLEKSIDHNSVIANIALVGNIDPAIVARVICSKGKNKGRLISTCPPVFGPKADKQAAAVWLGIQPNPFKVSVGKVLFLDKENQELCCRLGKIKWPAWLDADKASLVGLGVW